MVKKQEKPSAGTWKKIGTQKRPRPIPNKKLTLINIPAPDASWGEIQRFALTFNGYQVNGSFEKCSEIAKAKLHDSLDNIRTCLFFEQRRWRHFGESPSGDDLAYIKFLVEMIREYAIAGKN